MIEDKGNGLEYEKILLNFILTRDDIRSVVLPHLKSEIFLDFKNKSIVNKIISFVHEFKTFPKPADIKNTLEDKELINHLDSIVSRDLKEYTKESLTKEIEKFFKNRLYWNVLAEYIELLKENKELDISKFQKANTFFFDSNIGLDVMSDAEKSYECIHTQEEFIKCSMPKVNDFLGGGFQKGGMTLFLGATNKGKSLIMASLAADLCLMNEDVLYITLEMSEKRILRRTMTNIFDTDLYALRDMPREKYISMFERAKNKIQKKMIIKYYPAKSINTNKIRHLLKELKEKKGFVPSVVFVDYLGLINPNTNTKDGNSNTALETASQELFGLAGEENIALVSAMQFNRTGMDKGGMGNIAGSIGTTFTADVVLEIYQDEDLKRELKYKLKNVKGRDIATGVEIFVNVDYSKMMIYDDETTSLIKRPPNTNVNLRSGPSLDNKDIFENNKNISDLSGIL